MNRKNKIWNAILKFTKSIWFFPILLTIILLTLTSLNLNGSSIGVYYKYFYGNTHDPNLVLNKPRDIRSDEWVVNTQMALAQVNDSYAETNPNLGNGVDMSLIIDAPYAGISQIFKPHNLSFFVLPFSFAFAFKWWFMGYLLILSVYFFVLALLPKLRNNHILAALLSVSVFFAPFIQWWYQYITLAPIYYSLFAGTLFILLTRATSRNKKLLITVALAYVLTSLALVQYPAFQIPCILVMIFFVAGYFIKLKLSGGKRLFKDIVLYCLAASVVALVITGGFLYTKRKEVETIANTVYPGSRNITSGGYSLTHLLDNNLSFQFQFSAKANAYSIQKISATNQSESSSFILLIPFLLIPSLYLLYRNYKYKKKIDVLLFTTMLSFVLILVWLFVPNLDAIGSLTLLNKVPSRRLLIAIGILNILSVVLFMKLYNKLKKIPQFWSILYSLGVLAVFIVIGLRVHEAFPAFISAKWAIALAIPIPIVVYLLLAKKYLYALIIFCAFSILSSIGVNPLYRGTDVLTNNAISSAIQSVNSPQNKRWVVEDSLLQSFAFINGKPSLTGIYTYPQPEIWQPIDADTDIYNRYAHVNFVFDRDPNKIVPTTLGTHMSDHFAVFTEPCSKFMHQSNVGYIVTSGTFDKKTAPCATLIRSIPYPTTTYHIYHLDF